MVKRLVALVAALGGAGFAPMPAVAQMQSGVLVIYGDDRCPTDTEGNEIVVCARRPETERYRIPKELRDYQVAPQKQSWALRQRDVMDSGATGIGSCSAVGPGGSTGCLGQQIQQARALEQKRREAETMPED